LLLKLAAAGAIVSLAASGASAGNTEAVNNAIAKNATIAVYYHFNQGIVRSKGVRKVTHPNTGVYCVKPKKKINTQKHIASVNVAHFLTGRVVAHWYEPGTSCPNPKRWFEVRTYGDDGDNWTSANAVSWSLIVP
jgi:hypothetical protein